MYITTIKTGGGGTGSFIFDVLTSVYTQCFSEYRFGLYNDATIYDEQLLHVRFQSDTSAAQSSYETNRKNSNEHKSHTLPSMYDNAISILMAAHGMEASLLVAM